MRRFLSIAWTGVASAALNRARSVAVVLSIVAVLLPYVAGLGITWGLRDQVDDAVALGADLTVTGRRLGRNVPVPLSAAEILRAVPGVKDVVPRIVGEVRLGTDRVSAVLVGLPAERTSPGTELLRGRLPSPEAKNELVVGSQLARRLALDVGSKIYPFYRNESGEHVSTVVGVFRSDLPIWEASLVFATLETAYEVFEQKDLVTSLLVTCEPGRVEEARKAIALLPSLGADDGHGPLRPHVTSREDLEALLPRGVLEREGIFSLYFVLAFAVGIPLLLVTSGVGLTDRRRETALMKATGWQTDEVLLRGMAESLLLSVIGASIAVLLAFAWLQWLGGWGIASVFLPGVEASPGVEIPFRLWPVPVLLSFTVSFVVVMTGTLYATWRAATSPPAEAMR